MRIAIETRRSTTRSQEGARHAKKETAESVVGLRGSPGDPGGLDVPVQRFSTGTHFTSVFPM